MYMKLSCKKIFKIKAKNKKNIFVLGVSKVLSEGVNKIFERKKFIGVSAKKMGKGKKFQVWAV